MTSRCRFRNLTSTWQPSRAGSQSLKADWLFKHQITTIRRVTKFHRCPKTGAEMCWRNTTKALTKLSVPIRRKSPLRNSGSFRLSLTKIWRLRYPRKRSLAPSILSRISVTCEAKASKRTQGWPHSRSSTAEFDQPISKAWRLLPISRETPHLMRPNSNPRFRSFSITKKFWMRSQAASSIQTASRRIGALSVLLLPSTTVNHWSQATLRAHRHTMRRLTIPSKSTTSHNLRNGLASTAKLPACRKNRFSC